MSIIISPENRAAINKAIPLLRDAYQVMTDFAQQIETDLIDNSITSDMWGSYPAKWSTEGYLSAVYTELTVMVTWDDAASVWEITSIKSSCSNTSEELLP